MATKRWLALAGLCISLGANAAPTTLSEGFDTVVPVGWTVNNQSSPLGTTSWFQGNPGVFGAQAGAANSYAGANFNSAAVGGVISTWLISPQLDFVSQNVSFFVRGTGTPGYSDGLIVYVSENGASTDLGDFSLALSINGGNTPDSFPVDWTEFTMTLQASGSGRIAFRYVNGNADNADYIGLDSLLVGQPPVAIAEPGVLLLVALAVLALAFVRRGRLAGVALLAAFAWPAVAQTPAAPAATLPTFPNVRMIDKPATAEAGVPAGGGLVAAIDPETGQLVEPSTELLQELDRMAAARRAMQLPPGATMMQARRFRIAGGGWAAQLDESHMSYLVVRKAEGERLIVSCTVGEEAAQRTVLFGGPVAVARKEETQ